MQENNQTYNTVLKMCENEYSHEELIEFLKNGSIIERQHAALNINRIESNSEANIIMTNLVGVDGKIREAAALKIAELTKKYTDKFFDTQNYEILSKATIDIDGNVCRLAITSAVNLISNKDFAKYYAEEMIQIIKIALDEISKFTFRDKKYKINKQIFKIYWCLEALISFYAYCNSDELDQILEECSNLSEYTIREKCAKLLCVIPNSEVRLDIKNKLSQDENYYVRNIFK